MEKQPTSRRNAPALSVYLGPPEIAEKRLAALDRLAERLGTTRSQMIQRLADGRLMLVVAPDPEPLARAG